MIPDLLLLKRYNDIMTFEFSFGLGYMPVLWSFLTVLTLAASYTMAVVADHVYPFLPSISSTGAHVPESNIFSLLMNVSIILAAANYFTRYFQCQHQARHCGDNREVIYKYNQIALMVAITSLAGALVVANIQAKRVSSYQFSKAMYLSILII